MKHDVSATPLPEPADPQLNPLDRWTLKAALELEQRSGISLVAPLFAADELRRAAASAALAAWDHPDSDQQYLFADVTAGEFAEWLLTENPHEIAQLLDAGVGDPPLAVP